MLNKHNRRQTPTDLDQPPEKLEPVLDFEFQRPWPERYFGQRFGPGYINRVLASGRYILCTIDQIPEEWSVDNARWVGEILEVHCLQGWRVPDRIWTVGELKGVRI